MGKRNGRKNGGNKKSQQSTVASVTKVTQRPATPSAAVTTEPKAVRSKVPSQVTARVSASAKKSDNKPNHTQSMEQQRAAFALTTVASVAVKKEEIDKLEQDAAKRIKDTAKRFKAYANSLPAMIQSSGLGQSLAFAKAKGNGKGPEAGAWLAIYKALDIWLQQQHIWPDAEEDSDVLALLVQGDQMQYRRAQAEAQALLVWLKQFARADIAEEG